MINQPDNEAGHDPLAEIERHLIAAYVAGAGERIEDVLRRGDDDARQLLAEASVYASSRLSEIETRSHYLHELRGEA